MTAVEFLVKELPMVYWEDPYYSDLLKQAKEIERKQIIDAYDKGSDVDEELKPMWATPEEYYNETFKISQQDKP